MEPTDEALIQGCLQGDHDAWETLVLRYQRLVYSIPRRAGLTEDQSADVFQQVFVTLLEQLSGIRQPDRIKAWLVTTARRESWRVSRRSRSTGRLNLAGDEEGDTGSLPHLVAADPLPDEVVIRIEEQHAVSLAVDRLDDRCRRLLRLLFYTEERPSYAEIAEDLGTSEGSIGPTRARCLEKLRGLLVESGL